MSAFAILIRNSNVAALAGGPAANNDPGLSQRWLDWMRELQSTGHLKDPGNPLSASGGTIRGRKSVVTDGPYMEAKDVIGGYMLLEARDLSEALTLAKGCPILEADGAVEVRAVAQFGG